MDLGLQGRVAFVCGASAGMGRAIAEELAREGASVVLASRSLERLTPVVDGIRAAGGRAIAAAGDMVRQADVAASVAVGRESFGPIDIAVSASYFVDAPNARPGMALPGIGFDTTTDDEFRHMYEDHVMGVVHLTREVLPHMREQGWGRLLNIGSCAMKEAHREPLHYLANLRIVVSGLMKSLSNEVGRHGITANVIAPGPVTTPSQERMMEGLAGDASLDSVAEWTEKIPMGRMGRPEDAGALAAFLASERAGWITGQTILLDGGYTRATL
jgi:3-oxoacyl-[acyl-carrier protein] reductase